jgi:hypothetical protein
VYYSKRRLLKKDSAPRGRIALPRQQLGAGCSKDGLEQYVPATMGKWPLHSLRLSTFRPATLLPHLSFSAFQLFSVSAFTSLPLRELLFLFPFRVHSRPFAVQNLLILNSGRDAHAPWGSRCNKDDSSKGPLGTKAPA